jgi:hypothetical protein
MPSKTGRNTIPTFNENDAIWKALKTLYDESDRGCALVAGAWIDERLASLLHTYFEACSGNTKDSLELFHWLLWKRPDAPLMSTGIKCRLCRALGLINETFYRVINRIAEIRNQHFAHFALNNSFENTEVQGLIFGLKEMISGLPDANKLFWDRSDVLANPIRGNRHWFIGAVGTIILELNLMEIHIAHGLPPSSYISATAVTTTTPSRASGDIPPQAS